ncbi:MAG TPA: CHAP domain-containing protein [Candidatus Dormibacteraeota bacterium]|nr:CHAP domain-containing protein [Candidatus Dormibacteraeota bacterium]
MNRTVGVTLRLTVGGGALFAFGFGAMASVPQRPITAAADATIVPLSTPVDQITTPIEPMDLPRPHQARAAAMIYLLATPEPTPAVAQQRTPLAARPMSQPRAVTVAPIPATGAGFSYGYCTWWVAHKRYIPWRGNAYEWWWNARAFGFAEGPTPRAGAVMVMGISGTSPQGHVAYVESVNANGSFVVSEMNWWGVPGGGWNRLDYRTVTSMRGVLGFIY